MEKKLNLHDLFGILFPGAVLCGTAYVFLVRIDWIAGRDLGFSETLTLLPFAYVAGVILHVIGSRLFHESELALRVMDETDDTFTPQFKSSLRLAFQEVFALPPDGNARNRQMLFNGCYDDAVQRGKANYAENEYAAYALCRSMVLVTVFAVLLGGIVTFREWPATATFHPLFDMLCLVGAGTALVWVFWTGKEKFIKAFTRSVYRTFYSAYRDVKVAGERSSASPDDDDD